MATLWIPEAVGITGVSDVRRSVSAAGLAQIHYSGWVGALSRSCGSRNSFSRIAGWTGNLQKNRDRERSVNEREKSVNGHFWA